MIYYQSWRERVSQREVDCLCVAIDADVDLRLHKISCAFLLQAVRLSPLVPVWQCWSTLFRIFTNGRVVYAIRTMVVLVTVWTVAFFFTNLLQCFPISVNWTGWGAAVDSCINTNEMFLAQAWSDVITDGNRPTAARARQDSNKLNSNDSLFTYSMRTLILVLPSSNR